MSVIRIAADAEARAAGLLEWVVASSPARLGLVADGADVRAVDGSAGWSRRAEDAVRDGVSGVVIIAPGAEDVADLRTVAADHGAFLIVDQRWRSNPAVAEARDAVAGLPAPLAFSEITIAVARPEDVDGAVLEAAQIAHDVVGPVGGLRVVHRQTRSALLAGAAGGAPLTISVAVGPVVDRPLELLVVSRTVVVQLSVPDPETAMPGLVAILLPEGRTTRPTRWESAHRASWRRVIDVVDGGGRPDDLADVERAVRLLPSPVPPATTDHR